MPATHTILDARACERTLRRMADEIVERTDGADSLVLVGIQRRGVQLAARLAQLIEAREGVPVPRGALDITLYRDDLQTIRPRSLVGATELPVDINGKQVVIVDDVLYTGRTVRAPLDELADFGRLARPLLAVLIDRGGQELPIRADVIGKDLLDLESLSAAQITAILDTAEPLKAISLCAIKKVPTLHGETIVNLFFEASTRTRVHA